MDLVCFRDLGVVWRPSEESNYFETKRVPVTQTWASFFPSNSLAAILKFLTTDHYCVIP